MNVEIVTTSDDNFKITNSKFGEQVIASDGERVSIGVNEEEAIQGIKDMTPQPVVDNSPKPAPLENSREGHPFDLFGGTGWAGKRQPF